MSGPDSLEDDAVLRKRLRRIGVSILAAGLLAAALAFAVAAPDDGSGAVAYEIVDGKSYPVMLADSKRYNRDLERIGGKSAVLGVEFMDWFRGLWHGRRLAYTLASLSAGGFLVCFYLAHRLDYPR